MRNFTLFLYFVLFLYGSVWSRSLTIYVDDDAPGVLSGEEYIHDGSNWEGAFTNLQEALDIVADDPGANWTIYVAGGTYKPTTTSIPGDPRSACFKMYNNVVIYGSFAKTESGPEDRTNASMLANKSILSGDIDGIEGLSGGDCYHVVYNTSDLALTNAAILDGFTIKGGNADGLDLELKCGAGMYNDHSSPTITNCIFTSNYTYGSGSGISNFSSSPTLSNCTFISNSSNEAGSGMSNYSSSPILADCIFTSNSANLQGGGMYNEESSPSLTNCSFTDNSSGFPGGGMSNVISSSPILTNCVFTSNTANTGGGMYNNNSSPAIINCVFKSNSATTGGGMYNENHSSPTITNCTFTSNSSPYDVGGGIYESDYSTSTFNNCIIWGNTASEGNQFYIVGATTTLNYSCYANGSNDVTVSTDGTFTPDANCITTDPILGYAFHNPDHPYSIFGISPCKNAGNNSYNSELHDIRGQARIQNGTIDMGAYEWTEGIDQELRIFYVSQAAGSGLNIGAGWTNAFTSLQSALNAATSGDKIWVAAGTYKPSVEAGGTGNRFKTFQMKNGVAIYGGFAGDETLLSQRDITANETILSGDLNDNGIDDNDSYHVFYHPTGLGLTSSAVLDGFTIKGGNANGSSSHTSGGGMFNRTNSPALINCTFTLNSASQGGGVYNRLNSPTLTNCTFTLNSASQGGGIENSSATLTLINCTFTLNSATYGGGMHSDASPSTLINCIFSSNSATYGGGIHEGNASSTLTNCTLTSNSAGEYGGGIYLPYSSSTLNNCIIWGNTAILAGNQIYLSGDGGRTLTLNYCCYENGEIYCSDTFTSEHCITTDPEFVGAASNPAHPYSIKGISPCTDAGNNDYISESYDIRGNSFPRKLNKLDGTAGTVDIGAYEYKFGEDLLPVELTSFTAVSVDKGIQLNWTTATEVNNYGFEIERNTPLPLSRGDNAVAWEKIGCVAGAGNSNSPKEYSFVDSNPIPGNAEYRLKQIDLDGNYKYYSNIAKINYLTNIKEKQIPKEFGLSQNYPNPFNPSTVISYQLPVSGNVTLKVFNVLGKEVATLVNEQKQAGYYQVKFDGSKFASGMYIYKLTSGKFVSTKKLMLMK